VGVQTVIRAASAANREAVVFGDEGGLAEGDQRKLMFNGYGAEGAGPSAQAIPVWMEILAGDFFSSQ